MCGCAAVQRTKRSVVQGHAAREKGNKQSAHWIGFLFTAVLLEVFLLEIFFSKLKKVFFTEIWRGYVYCQMHVFLLQSLITTAFFAITHLSVIVFWTVLSLWCE